MPRGLYLHYPFCRNQCSYCDYFHLGHSSQSETDFFEALLLETKLVAEDVSDDGQPLQTIYIGGGTPSLVELEPLERWLDLVRARFKVSDTIEFSFETNPESVSLELLQDLKRLGVTRPVFGVQSFDTGRLRLLGRHHRIHDTHQAVYYARALDFESFGCDLLFGLPEQTAKMLSADLDHLADIEPPHISFYQLTVEAGTRLAREVDRGRLKLPDADFIAAVYQAGHELLSEAGYERYEVCSFAKPGHECRHNSNYWQMGDYLGLGPSAHSFIGGRRFANVASLPEYLDAVRKGQRPLVEDDSSVKQRMVEAIMLGLRTVRGVDCRQFERLYDSTVEAFVNPDEYERLSTADHLVRDGDYLKLNDDSMLLADEIARRLVG